jgi:hypothetical protein
MRVDTHKFLEFRSGPRYPFDGVNDLEATLAPYIFGDQPGN